MNENNNEQEQPLYKEQPWWVQIFVALYAMFWLTMIFAAGLNSLYIGKIDIDSVSMAVALTQTPLRFDRAVTIPLTVMCIARATLRAFVHAP